MRTICVINLKGGVAKTATTVNMAAILARCHKKHVLVVDGDSQANTSEFFASQDVMPCTLTDALRGEPDGGKLAKLCIVKSNFPGIDLLPADDRLMDLDLSQISGGKVYTDCLRDLKSLISYDYVIIDCPPAFNAASAAALIAADEVIIPMQAQPFSVVGMSQLTDSVFSVQRKINPKLHIMGILLTMTQHTKVSEHYAADVRARYGNKLRVFDTEIPYNVKVQESQAFAAPTILYEPKSSSAKAYLEFTKEVVGHGREEQVYERDEDARDR